MADVFDSTPVTETPTPSPVNDLVGEGKKFKTVEDLAKAKLESDRFIEQLKFEQAALRQELSDKEDLQAQLNNLREELKSKPANQPRDGTRSELSEGEVEALVARVITRQEAAKTTTQNINDANKKLVDLAGSVEKAQALVQSKAGELGMTVDQLKQIASQSPTAFIKMVSDGSQKATPTISATGGSVVPPSNGENKPGTKAYFDNIRKTNKKLYFTPTIQNQIMDAVKAGTYDTN